MKAKELAEKLLEHPDFEVEFTAIFQEYFLGQMIYDTYKITGIADIGHSDKVIILDGELDD